MLLSMARWQMEGIRGSSAGGGLSGRVRCFRRRRSSRGQNNDYHISISGVNSTVISTDRVRHTRVDTGRIWTPYEGHEGVSVQSLQK